MLQSMTLMAAAPAAGAPGDIGANEREIARLIDQAKAKGAGLLALPELCLTGFGCGDLFRQAFFTQAAEQAALRLASRCEGLACLIGLPVRTEEGVFSAMLAVEDGRALGLWLRATPVPWLARSLSVNVEEGSVPLFGRRLPLLNGRVLWLKGGEALRLSFEDTPNTENLTAAYFQEGADIAVFPAARPALAGGSHERRMAALKAARQGGVCVLVNAGANESTTDYCYDGQALIAQGGRLAEAEPFSGEAALSNRTKTCLCPAEPAAPEPALPYAPPAGALRAQWCREAVEIAAQALAARMRRIGGKTLLLGLSGGLDSAMALLSCCRACDILGLDKKESVLPYALPGPASGSRTQDNSRHLALALGLALGRIDISGSVARHLSEIGHGGEKDAAFENAQARERTQILMDLANMKRGIMVGTGDLSELALGFTTYGGDHLSMYGVNAGLYKTAIRLILHQAAEDSESPALRQALLAILDTPVSPELLPGRDGEIAQKTEEILGPYELNDFYLHHLLKNACSPRWLVALAKEAFTGRYDERELISRLAALLRRFFAAQFKRSCSPDGPQLLSVSLSPRGGLELPSDASCALWLSETDDMMRETEECTRT